MKITKIILPLLLVIMLVCDSIALVGCSSEYSFIKVTGIAKSQITKVELVSEFGATKDMTAQVDSIYELLSKQTFRDNSEGKVASDMYLNVDFTINFYIAGVDGYYSMLLNNGFEAHGGFDYKKSRTGFYQLNNAADIKAQLYTLFHSI